MKQIFYTTIAFAIITLVGPIAGVGGAEIEGIQFNERYEIHGVRLKVQGTGVLRYLGLIKAYVGVLYVEEGESGRDVLSDTPKRLEVEYFHAFKGKDFGITTNKIIQKNTDSKTLKRIRSQIDYHNSLYEDVQPGDRYSLTYIPGRGTELALNGRIKGVIKGAEFAAALFSMWLGEHPMDKSFKQQLLGLK